MHDEYFQRIRPTTLGALLNDLASAEESVYELGEEAEADIGARSVAAGSGSRSIAASTRSVALSVVHHSEAQSPPPSAHSERAGRILLLDVRSPEAYNTWHVRGAVSYPPSQMIHASNSLPRDIYYYKGPRELDAADGSGKMVIVIDDDGKTTAPYAGNLLVQKGVDNTYVVHGGLEQFAPRFPHLLEGDVPPLPPVPPSPAPSTLAALARKGGTIGGSGPRTSPSSPSVHSARTSRTVNTRLSGVASSRANGGTKLSSAWK